ncbi:unnamed protein product [Albugo candida]|uniref:EF-hand domain-containing protein n=2 Tax=Albugo candida TaxID=65357 RepID=A0A024GD70_9STRA|nr:unnamed protein product [Albugo candida]|eukprot:CCI44278.1 unnamed protein product [Albugo candida]
MQSDDTSPDSTAASFALTQVNEMKEKHITNLTYAHDPEKGFTMDIMMLLDMQKISILQKEFDKKKKGLTLVEFVQVMVDFVQALSASDRKIRLKMLSEPELIANLCDLFAQIDINGDGTLEWKEFTSFIVETGLVSKNQQFDSLHHYYHVPKEESSKHNTSIEHVSSFLYYFPSKNVIAITESTSPILKLYDTQCELQATIKSPHEFILCAEHLPRAQQYAISSSDLQIRFYDDTSLRLVKGYHISTSQNCLQCYPESDTMYSAGASGIVYAWDTDTMEEKYRMGGEKNGRALARSHDDAVLDLLNIPTLESLASASMDRSIRLWDVNTGKIRQILQGHKKGVRALAYSAEYRVLMSAGFDFDVFVWNPYVKQLISRLHGHNNSLCGVEMVENTPKMITADVDGIFKVWDVRNFGCVQTFTAESIGAINEIAMITPKKQIVAGGKKLVRFDYAKLEHPKLTDDHPIICALYNSTSLSFLTAAGRDIKIWDAQSGRIVRVYRNVSQADVTSVCLDARQRKILVGNHDGRIEALNYLNGSHMKSFEYGEMDNKAHRLEVSCLCYCPDHMMVISASWDCSIHIHDESDSEQGLLLRQLCGGHTVDISALTFSRHLSMIASGSSDASLQLWTFEFGQLDQTCIGHVSGILSLLFIDPYPLLLATDGDGNICFWATRPSAFKGKCVYRIQNHSSIKSKNVNAIRCVAIDSTPNSEDQRRISDPYLLASGDDTGFLSVWDLRSVLTKLENNFDIKKLQTPHKCTNPRRKLQTNVDGAMRTMKKTLEWKSFQKRDPRESFYLPDGYSLITDSKLMRLQNRWKAHDDIIYSIQLFHNRTKILSGSFDRHVKIWSLEGDCLGVLMQGVFDLVRREWKFSADYEDRERRMEKDAISIIEHMKMQNEQKKDINKLKKDASVGTDDTEADAQSDFLPSYQHADFILPPIQSPGSGCLEEMSTLRDYKRKTIQRKPVGINRAGRTQILSPRQLAAQHQPGKMTKNM